MRERGKRGEEEGERVSGEWESKKRVGEERG